MEIRLDRKWKKPKYTIGRLYVNGVLLCNTLEDTDRGLTQDMPLHLIQKIKIPGETAIPTGRYEVVLNVISKKFKSKPYYMKFCGGALPRLLNVPGFSGILFHRGAQAADTMGCILVGENTQTGKLTNSQGCFECLYHFMEQAIHNNERIFITIE